jgi:hypothetical protein
VARRPEKKREPTPPAIVRVLPMQLQVRDRFTDEEGEWEVTNRPFSGPMTSNDLLAGT